MVEEKVRVTIDTVANLLPFLEFLDLIKDLEKSFQRASSASSNLTSVFNKIGNDVMRNQRQLELASKSMKKNLEERFEKTPGLFAYFSRVLRGFKLEMISVMFFGYALQRMVSGLTKPAADAAGLFDIWRVTLQVLFLPTMLKLLPVMLKLLNFIINLSNPVKEAIGMFTLWIGAIGGILAGFVSWGLAMKSIGATALLVGGTVAGVVALIVGSIVALALAWATNFQNIREKTASWMNNIKNIFSSGLDFILNLFNLFVGIMTLDLDKILSSFRGVFINLMSIAANAVSFIGGQIGHLLDIINLVIPGFKQWGINVVTSIVQGIMSVGHKLAEALFSILPSWAVNAIGKTFGGLTTAVSSFATPSITPTQSLGSSSFLNSSPYNVSYSPSYNISVSDKSEFERMLNQHDKDVSDTISKMVKG